MFETTNQMMALIRFYTVLYGLIWFLCGEMLV